VKRIVVVAFALAAVHGCAHRQTMELTAGLPDGVPAIETLPSLGDEREAFTERMRFAWLLAEQSFQLETPVAPVNPSIGQLAAFTNGPLRTWLEHKNELVEAARAELDAAAEEAHVQRIVAGALVGLMYEDVWRVLRSVPVPTDLDGEPDIARVYQQVVDFQATPYLEHARRAYDACAQNAVRPEHMAPWSSYCATREERLPASDDDAPGTTVTVVRE
jgi:hypothetical protein